MDKSIGVEQARKELGSLVDAAHYSGECTEITKGNSREVGAVLVPRAWYREAEARRQAMVER